MVVAPDKFKGTLTAAAAARAMARGVRRVFPEAAIDLRPLADGGEGTSDALLAAFGGRAEPVAVRGPLGDLATAEIAVLGDGRACVEMAQASGLRLVDGRRRDALAASSRGTGDAILAALGAGATEIVVAVGGSATTDGGAGAASALGWRFLDGRGRDLPFGGGALRDLACIDGGAVDRRLADVRVVGACDVAVPLLGPRGTARVFAPQKGASPADVERLEESMAVLAERIHADVGVDVRDEQFAGAGGGMGAGLVAFFSATTASGFDVVSDAVGLPATISGARAVVTGEGRLDRQSLSGKVPVAVARIAARARVPCVVVAGEIDLDPEAISAQGVCATASLVEVAGRPAAVDDAATAATAATARALERCFARGRAPRRRFIGPV